MASRKTKQKKVHDIDPFNDVMIYDLACGYINVLKHGNGQTGRRANVLKALSTIGHIAMEKDWKSLTQVQRHIESTFDEALNLMTEDTSGRTKK